MALKDMRPQIIAHVNKHIEFLKRNAEVLDIYNGNLLPYVDSIMKTTLSTQYYEKIRERIIPINILQRYTDKVSTTYEVPPARSSKSKSERVNDFVGKYSAQLNMDASGQVADEYSNLFKAFAWEPYIDDKGMPQMRELSFDKFLVMSTSKINPEVENIFIKFMGCVTDQQDSLLMFTYTNEEFDAFYLNETEAPEYLRENLGINPVGTIPFLYGKRQKNQLIPTQDTDMLAIGKALSVMLTDAAGAQMFQCFSIIYGIDINVENISMSPNALWSFKSDNEKKPEVGTVKPEADTDKVLEFVKNIFILWLETKGVRVGSIGSTNGQNFSSGFAKIIDEMDTISLRIKSAKDFKADEQKFWNTKMPMIHNYWVKNNLLSSDFDFKGLIEEKMDVVVDFGKIEPKVDRDKLIASIKSEIDLGTMTLEQGIRKLHPEYDDEKVKDVIANREIV